MNHQLLRKLPKTDDLLRCPALAKLCSEYGIRAVTESIRKEIDILRQGILSGQIQELPEEDTLYLQIRQRAQKDSLPSFRRIINGTGIILHTNLGRACLSAKAAQAAADAAFSYTNLEYDLPSGKRGTRYIHVEPLLCQLTGAESALVVNNNAAAVLLILTALTQGGQVPVSRGELVEIGGSFRIPEIMESCGAQLKEVGATNKTHLRDYERAINSETKAILKVHTSNYRIVGFSETPALADLVKLGHQHDLPVIEDLGSGSLLNLEEFGLHGEPSVQDSIRAGVDVVSFSGDKLLGGPQAGIILGRKKYLDLLKKHPLTRAVRVDKMTLAALEATLRSYAADTPKEVPVIQMLSAEPSYLKEKAERLKSYLLSSGILADVVPVDGQVGGGSVPNQSLPSFAVALSRDSLLGTELARGLPELEERLRLGLLPVIGRIHNDQYLLDVRTISEEDFTALASAIKEALS